MIKSKAILTANWGRLVSGAADKIQISHLINALDDKYDLLDKIVQEVAAKAVIEQHLGRLIDTFGGLSAVSNQRILDIACGSNSSQAPPSLSINTPLQTSTFANTSGHSHTALFEPWFCRILLALGATPVGIDFGDLSGEIFEHYQVDLTKIGALDFLPSHSFDAVQDSRLFGSPEFTALLPDRAARRKVAQEISKQEQRLLKEGGILIHSDAAYLLGDK